jgi:AcrR family transcriptional regulator
MADKVVDKGPDKTADLLLQAAKTIFARLGYDGATVKAIADQAGVNISLVSYHFDGKEGLFRACFEKAGMSRVQSAQKFLLAPKSVEEFRVRLMLYADDFIQWSLDEPEVVALLHRECMGEMALTKDIFRNTFLKGFDLLSGFFESAKRGKLLQQKTDPFLAAGLFYGSLIHMVRTQTLAKELYGLSLADGKTREKVVEAAVNQVLFGIIDPSKGKPA